MSFGLPVHLAPLTQSRSFARAIHATAFTCLVGAALMALSVQLAWPALVVWPAIVALLPMGVILYLLDSFRTMLLSVSYLVVGGISVYLHTLTIASQLDLPALSDVFGVALPKIALVLIGGAGVGALSGLRWCTAGYLVAEVASAAALLQTGSEVRIDVRTLSSYVATALILVLAWSAARGAHRATPRLHRAAVDKLVSELRNRIEMRAAALLHDTVLSDLAAIGSSAQGALSPALGDRVRRDLDELLGGEWLTDPGPRPADGLAVDQWQGSELRRAIKEAEEAGVEVDVTGEPSTVARLSPACAEAVGLALRQCLVNVLKHSGTTDAEVAIHAVGDQVLVMVIDTGRGFVPEEVGADRLGLRASVHGRIEAVGGTAQVWSTPGMGTSVVFRVPVDADALIADRRATVGGESA